MLGLGLRNFGPFRLYGQALTRRPVLTQICSGTVLVTVGDGLAQHLVEHTAWQAHDWRRTGDMVLLRGVLHSTMIIYWYRLLHHRLPMPNSSRYARLGTHLSLDQGLFGPANVAFFFVASGALEGKAAPEIREKLDERLWETITSAWLLWVPFQFLTFRFIPMDYRLISGQAVAIGWNCYM